MVAPTNKVNGCLSFQAFAIFCGIGIHNTNMYEQTSKLLAKQMVAMEVRSIVSIFKNKSLVFRKKNEMSTKTPHDKNPTDKTPTDNPPPPTKTPNYHIQTKNPNSPFSIFLSEEVLCCDNIYEHLI